MKQDFTPGTCKRIKRKENFTIVDNSLFDLKIGMDSILLLMYCLSLPDNWVFHKTHLQKKFNVGRTIMDRMFKELESTGYLVSLEMIRNEQKQFTGRSYIFYDEPFNGEPMVGEPLAENPSAAQASTETAQLINTNSNKYSYNKKEYKENSSTSFPDEFLDLWNKYGKVGDKVPSFKAWKKLSSTEQQKALGAVGAYVASTVKDDSENGVGKAWRPRRKHLSTWLNSRAWEEEMIVKEEPVETEEECRVRLRFEELQAQMNEYDRKIREFTEYWDARIFGDVSKLPEDAYIEIRDLNLEKSSITPAYQHYKMLYDRQTKK